MSERVSEALRALDEAVGRMGPATMPEAHAMATGLIERAVLVVLGALEPERAVVGRVAAQVMGVLLELREEVLKDKPKQ